MTLEVAPCGKDAAEWAVTRWHYSRKLPPVPLMHGVWSAGSFIGAVIYSRSPTPTLGSPYGLLQTEVCELARVALGPHDMPVSQVVMTSIRTMAAANPAMRLVVSFADPAHGHHGGIYQAMNWIYAGETGSSRSVFIGGQWQHQRTTTGAGSAYLRLKSVAEFPVRHDPPKHRYLWPLDRAMRRRITPLALPYPRAAEGSTVSRS